MFSVYFFNYYRDGEPGCDDVSKLLKRYGDLPGDFENKEVGCSFDPPEITKGKDVFSFSGFCPELNLYHPNYAPGYEKNTALSAFSWREETGVTKKEYKHFSECLEFIQSCSVRSQIKSKVGISAKVRFSILKRDGFKCLYCGKTQVEGAVLHVDHKISKNDGGSDEPDNLVTSCQDCNLGKGKDSL
jgi:5-methylcytosine-specific restriction endonuclease McrA